MADVVGLTSNVLKRVVRIEVGPSSGTAFTLDVDRHHYLVTAKHVIAPLKGEQGTIKVCVDGGKCVDTEVDILRCADPIDIAVLVPKTLLTATFALPADMSGIVLGQDVYFVGFPYADPALTTMSAALENIGFVRKAVWSAQTRKDGVSTLYYDGRNNPGFSGAPIVFLKQGRPGYDFIVAAVVSGYRPDYTEVLVPKLITDRITDEDRALNRIVELDGKPHRLLPTRQYVPGNTGIVVGYSIEHAVDLIRASKVKGPEVK